jgi:hypothetical protein
LQDCAKDASMSFEAYRVADRGAVIFGWQEGIRHWGPEQAEAIEHVARVLSLTFVKALAVHFNDMLNIREASLYQEGKLIRWFGEEDELWAPMDGKGDVLPDAPRCPGSAVPEDENYAFVWDGIDAGLEAGGFRGWLPTGGLLYVADRDNLIWERQGGSITPNPSMGPSANRERNSARTE